MKEHCINTMIYFCAFVLTLSKLVPSSSHSIHLCRDVCGMTETCVLFQEGIVTFACHRQSIHGGDTGETFLHSSQTPETDTDMKCTEPCKSVLENSILKTKVNIGRMVHGTANRDQSQITSYQQTGEKTQHHRNTQSRSNVQTQDPNRMKTNLGGLTKTKPPSSPPSKPPDQESETKGTGRGRMNGTKPSSPSHSSVINQDSKSKGAMRGRLNETTHSSPKRIIVLNQDSKNMGTLRGKVNETSSPLSINQDSKRRETGSGSMNETNPSSTSPNSVIKHDSKGRGTGSGSMNETNPSSTSPNSVIKHDSKGRGTGRGRMNETTRSDVLNHDTKSKGTERGRMNETTRSPTTRSGVPNHNTKSKGTEMGRMNETTRSGVPNNDTKSKGIARGRMYYTKPSSPSRKSAIKQDSKRRGTERGRMNETTRSGVPNHNTKSKGTERGRINETTRSSTTRSGVPNHDTKSKGIERGRMFNTKPSSPSRNSTINQDSKRKGTERGRMHPSQAISIQSQYTQLGIKATVTKEPTPAVDLNTSNSRERTVKQIIPKSQPNGNMYKKQVNEKKTGGDDVSQMKKHISPSRRGYEQLKAGSTTSSVKRYAEKKTWEKALEKCRSDGGTLVKLDTRLKNRSLMRKYAFFKSHWIGLKDVYDNDTFFWIDGSSLTFSKWQNGEPHHKNDAGGKENCADLSVNFFKGQGWTDQPCDKLFQFICEI